MMGTSYNGSLPIAAAATGVQGLEAIVPISPVSDYYEYYRANGMVRGPGGWQGEDADVLVDVVYTRQDETYPRMKCRALIEQIGRDEDRVTGDRNAFWDARNLNALVPNMHAAVLLAHGNNDNNVMTKNATAFYEAVKKQGLPHQFFFHQGGHGGAPPDVMVNRWFTKFLYGQNNGAETPAALVGRAHRDRRLPAARVDGHRRGQANTTTLTVADAQHVPARLHADDPADERERHDHEHDAGDHQHPGQHADARVGGRHGRRSDGRRRRGREPRVRQRQPDAVRRVARPGRQAGHAEADRRRAVAGGTQRGGSASPPRPRRHAGDDHRQRARSRRRRR